MEPAKTRKTDRRTLYTRMVIQDALLELLRQTGYEIKNADRPNPSLRGGSQKRFIRLDSIGPGYSAADLRAVIAGERAHTPKPKRKAAPETHQRSNQLLIDIQAKLREGKGAGYAHWARHFNLKQMAQAMNYLQEHSLTDYNALSEKASAASARFSALSAEIKGAEARMAEIAVMRTQIINYAKTRDVYAAYRKAGYSKKFKAEHEADILLHQAAKKYFDEQDLKKLPSVKSLQAEYAELLAKKKAAYADYREARNEMQELVTAKATVERILGKTPDREARTGPEKERR